MQCFICDNCMPFSLYSSSGFLLLYFCKCIVENMFADDFRFGQHITRRRLMR